MDDERLAEAIARYANIADVVGYVSENEQLAPLTQVLIRAGVAVDTRDPHDGNTALFDAASRGLIEDVEQLIALGADVNAANAGQERLLTVAVKRGDLAMVRLALDNGADVNASSNDGTPLMFAAMLRYEEIVRVLIDAGADVNIANDDGDTSLSLIAVSDSSPEVMAIVRLLLDAGADPNPNVRGGMSLIDMASRLGLTEIAELLLASAQNGV
ncbi:MAG: ankyrin repeat domain-containing protein [Gammaproteobacteria bacterium]